MKFRLFARKWVELETLMLNEIGEFHNDNYCAFSHVGSRGGEAIKVNRCIRNAEGEVQRRQSQSTWHTFVKIP